MCLHVPLFASMTAVFPLGLGGSWSSSLSQRDSERRWRLAAASSLLVTFKPSPHLLSMLNISSMVSTQIRTER